jgi:hypothetical protein
MLKNALFLIFTFTKVCIINLGGKNMEGYISWMEKNPKWLKLVLCLWILDITWAIFRILKAVQNNDMVQLILGILWIIAAGTIGWILDIIWIIVYDYPFWFK